ncbi:MAG: C-terminal domain, partial [Myxococcaceae bacterium]|nr:C-terminal domain [Myxococcaceae bacterium]
AEALIHECEVELERHDAYIRVHLEDPPAIRDFTWPVTLPPS